ncbi:cyclic nucleotide-binding domain-containing protein [soil metagenome]
MNELLQFLKSIYPFSDELEQFLRKNLHVKVLKRNELLLKAGTVCKNVYFIKTGAFRSFYYNDEGQETNTWFMKEGDVILSVESFFRQKLSTESIISIEGSEVHFIDYDTLQLLYRNFLEFNVISRVLLEHYYILSEQRLYAVRLKTAREKYHWLMQNFPEMILRIPSKYLASYLGMSAETFSRVKLVSK